MSPSEDALAERVKHLEKYTTTLHMVLDNIVQRVRKLEAATGMDEEGIQQSLEWRAKIEATLLEMILAQDWYWQDSDDHLKRSVGNVAYAQILQLCEMLPVDVQMRCWAKAKDRMPADLPLIWSAASPPSHSPETDPALKEKDRKLMKHMEKVKKYVTE